MAASRESDPATAFARLGNEVRLAIIRVLGEPAEPGRVRRLSFAELRDRVGVGNSSRFNYHLNELVGHYVEKDEGRYVITYPGLLVWTAMKKGVFEDPDAVTVEPFALATDCHECGEPLSARYEGGGFEVACPACGAFLYRRPLPPAAVVDADREGLLDAAGQRLLHAFSLRREGYCPVCAHEVVPRLLSGDDAGPTRDTRDLQVQVLQECDHCRIFSFNTVGEMVLTHPVVRGFLHERGVDAGRPWALPFAASDRETAVRSIDPWAVAVTVEADGDRLRAVVDGDLAIDVR